MNHYLFYYICIVTKRPVERLKSVSFARFHYAHLRSLGSTQHPQQNGGGLCVYKEVGRPRHTQTAGIERWNYGRTCEEGGFICLFSLEHK